MQSEYLPILEEHDGKLLVRGKTERRQAHTFPPVAHATAVIVAMLPDGRIILADKTEKQRKKGRIIPSGRHVYDILGGHMTYEGIPKAEYTEGLSADTFFKCAFRELSEELLRLDADGSTQPFIPDRNRFLPIGLYTLKNDHNREYSWAFLYLLPDFGPYTSEDTLITSSGEETIRQPVRTFTPEELTFYYKNGHQNDVIISDGIGRILSKNHGKELYNLMKENLKQDMTKGVTIMK